MNQLDNVLNSLLDACYFTLLKVHICFLISKNSFAMVLVPCANRPMFTSIKDRSSRVFPALMLLTGQPPFISLFIPLAGLCQVMKGCFNQLQRHSLLYYFAACGRSHIVPV